MDKSAIKIFAVESRRQLIESVKYQASLIGITSDCIAEPISKAEGMETYEYGAGAHSIFDEDINKRKSLVREINSKGFENVVEEVAYTWFNRIIAIRFMEVNDYLPTRTRVLSSEVKDKIEPDIITEALDLDFDYTDEDQELILKLKDENKLNDLFRFLFIKQCNKLNEILPGLFEKTDDYMELLLNISFTDENGVIRKLITSISEEDFGNQVEIIGWLYQFYNSELKDETFANLKKRVKIPKERIPAATQLFTPDWIVKYMIENSVGKLWLEGHPDDNLKSKWEYYIEDYEQDVEVKQELIKIQNQYEILKPEDIKVIDPCMGSGHILVYIFDVLMDIYISEGFTEKDACESILKHNLYGLDIDKRAYQLSYFAVLMKARKYNSRILTKDISPLLCSIEETNNISVEFIDELILQNNVYEKDWRDIYALFQDAKEYGSILDIKDINLNNLSDIINNFELNKNNLNIFKYQKDIRLMKNIIKQAKLLVKNYNVVVTNPPYMGSTSMNSNLKDYLKKNYPKSKADLFAVFIEKCHKLCNENGFVAMITQQSFMFLSKFEKLRIDFIKNNTICSMIHLGAHAFDEIGGEVVQATTFVNRNKLIKNYNSTFYRLTEFNSETEKENAFQSNINKFICKNVNFKFIPGSPIAYWVDENFINAFKNGIKLSDICDAKQGLASSDNNRFLRMWYEVNFNKIGFLIHSTQESIESGFKWFPHNKGGEFRKWYGNQYYVVNWENDGEEMKEAVLNRYTYLDSPDFVIKNQKYYFKKAITWSRISSSTFGIRFSPAGFIFDVNGPSLFIDDKYYYYIGGFLCSILSTLFFEILNPTLSFQVGNMNDLPIIINENKIDAVVNLVKQNIAICKEDWDDYEISWNFLVHPFLRFNNTSIEHSFREWDDYKKNKLEILKNNETQLNQIFAEIYSVNINHEINDSDISIQLANYSEDIKSFISYAVGCMFGRYSLDNEGLHFAGGSFDSTGYSKFIPDDDNIIPVLDTEYFTDDIVGRFVEFVKVCFGEETLEENLDFIANSLNKKGNTSREKIRNYFLKDFFKDHAKIYKKCPIYWQFDSGRQNAFKCLIYMHRYDPSIVARVRTDYLHKTQKAIEQNLSSCDNIIANSSNKSEISKATKDKAKYIKQLDEIRVYDEALGHMATQNIKIDLDDGVKVNYTKFQKVEISKEGEKTKKINLLKNI